MLVWNETSNQMENTWFSQFNIHPRRENPAYINYILQSLNFIFSPLIWSFCSHHSHILSSDISLSLHLVHAHIHSVFIEQNEYQTSTQILTKFDASRQGMCSLKCMRRGFEQEQARFMDSNRPTVTWFPPYHSFPPQQDTIPVVWPKK